MSSSEPVPFVLEEAFGGQLVEQIEARIVEAVKDLNDSRKKRDAERIVNVKISIKPASDGAAVRIRAEVNNKLAPNARLSAMGLVERDTLLEFPQPRPGRVLQLTLDEKKGEAQ